MPNMHIQTHTAGKEHDLVARPPPLPMKRTEEDDQNQPGHQGVRLLTCSTDPRFSSLSSGPANQRRAVINRALSSRFIVEDGLRFPRGGAQAIAAPSRCLGHVCLVPFRDVFFLGGRSCKIAPIYPYMIFSPVVLPAAIARQLSNPGGLPRVPSSRRFASVSPSSCQRTQARLIVFESSTHIQCPSNEAIQVATGDNDEVPAARSRQARGRWPRQGQAFLLATFLN
ncbi:hypothetical protein B0T22DRAFT_91429 [Podospora appendiculata]|uniref:Uncharacterized protein n=1 Tax=Podospora appendiculata TaxID=314037 RepID=A0AAE0XKH8_9PEZI|nr:hypothetical protein B0T22DRAFT_91429 [Podospora appendiculata]